MPKLLAYHSTLIASLVIGLLWGALHLALLLPGMMNEGASPLPTVLALVGASMLLTWIYINSGGSIVLTTLFHAAQSFFVIVNEGIPGPQQMWLMAGVYLAMALIVGVYPGPRLFKARAAPMKARISTTLS